jgi:pyrimidine-specific ribonucleoside hydrolase
MQKIKILILTLMVIVSLNSAGQRAVAKEATGGHDHAGVFSRGVLNPDLYEEDVRDILEETLKKYGEEEWRRVALTVEIHGHLGVYAIIGAKMGIRAKELLGGGTESLRVVTYAGERPPLSCLNDGIQVGTGATLGHGSIAVSQNADRSPVADFISGDQILRIALKDEISQSTDLKLKELHRECGGLTEKYWHEVRELGIRYWRELDRNEIFEIEIISIGS